MIKLQSRVLGQVFQCTASSAVGRKSSWGFLWACREMFDGNGDFWFVCLALPGSPEPPRFSPLWFSSPRAHSHSSSQRQTPHPSCSHIFLPSFLLSRITFSTWWTKSWSLMAEKTPENNALCSQQQPQKLLWLYSQPVLGVLLIN